MSPNPFPQLKISSWITGPNTDPACLSFLQWLFLQPGSNLDQVIQTSDPTLLHSAIELGAVEALALMLIYLDPNLKNEVGCVGFLWGGEVMQRA